MDEPVFTINSDNTFYDAMGKEQEHIPENDNFSSKPLKIWHVEWNSEPTLGKVDLNLRIDDLMKTANVNREEELTYYTKKELLNKITKIENDFRKSILLLRKEIKNAIIV